MFAFRGRGSSITGMVWDPIEMNPTLHPRSFFSQPTAVLTEYSSFTKKPFLVYVGDNWVFGLPHDNHQVISEMNTPPAGRFTERFMLPICTLCCLTPCHLTHLHTHSLTHSLSLSLNHYQLPHSLSHFAHSLFFNSLHSLSTHTLLLS